MRQPFWKRWLSHFVEQHIESAPSEINPHLYVSLSRGRYQLCTANAIYSFEDLYDNFRLTFDVFDFDRIRGGDVLLLGVGLGSVPQMLERNFDQQLHYTGVEIDENVLYLANKYVLHDLKSQLQMHVGDAWHFVESNSSKYDLVCMDVFVDDEVPDRLWSITFLEMLQGTLSDRGVLLYNCLARKSHDISKTRAFLLNEFLTVFPHGGYLDVRGNWMLVSDKTAVRQ